MSWYTDPQLFIRSFVTVYRVTTEFDISLVENDLTEREKISFSKHLSWDNNRESDYDDFKDSFPAAGIRKLINSQGLVIKWNTVNKTGTWSREELNSPFWSLPGIKTPEILQAENRALEKENSELKAKFSSLQGQSDSSKVEKEALDKRVLDLEAENAILKSQVNRERNEKILAGLKREEILAGLDALEKQVSDLTSKLVQCCGAAGSGKSVEEPWITGQTIPSNWVPFKKLDVLSKDIPLTITNPTGGSKFRKDNTTNVQANCFYRGIFPIVVVDIAELTPNREEARFDPDVWSSYNNNGIIYAARKPFSSEISVDEH